MVRFQSTHPSGVRPSMVFGSWPTTIFQSTHPSGVRLLDDDVRDGHVAISIHAPQWGATWPFRRTWFGSWNFNPRTPVGCDRLPSSVRCAMALFQSTHPSGVRPDETVYDLSTIQFQSTHPSGVRRSTSATRRRPARHFNPRTPVGCDDINTGAITGRVISIHAPQWGATRVPNACGRDCPISIHAPQWGATGHESGPMRMSDEFQSTHPSGVRLLRIQWIEWTRLFQSTHPSGVRRDSVVCFSVRFVRISIHAPQWGATWDAHPLLVIIAYFNPRTPVGCDSALVNRIGGTYVFQSTHPSGVRLVRMATRSRTPRFQSTHPSGVRRLAAYAAQGDYQFQSTHPSGVRLSRALKACCCSPFQSTHPSGVRLADALRLRFVSRISIHAPQWGATGPAGRLPRKGGFQSTHPSGVRPREWA